MERKGEGGRMKEEAEGDKGRNVEHVFPGNLSLTLSLSSFFGSEGRVCGGAAGGMDGEKE
jgi:hypothetical protein